MCPSLYPSSFLSVTGRQGVVLPGVNSSFTFCWGSLGRSGPLPVLEFSEMMVMEA